METNKDKALNKLIEETGYPYCDNCKFKKNRAKCDCSIKKVGWELDENIAKNIIELAAKPNWFYPSKGEFPEYNSLFVNENGIPCLVHNTNMQYLRLIDNTVHNIEDLKAWTYLPKFEEK